MSDSYPERVTIAGRDLMATAVLGDAKSGPAETLTLMLNR